MRVNGIPVSEGYFLGKAFVLQPFLWKLPTESDTAADPVLERNVLTEHIRFLSGQYHAQAEKLLKDGKKAQADLILSHDEILHDYAFGDEIIALVEEGMSAAEAVRRVAQTQIDIFSESGNTMLQERVNDIRDIASRLIRLIRGEEVQDINMIQYDAALFAEEIPTSLMAGLDNPHIKAIVTAKGGKTSHTGILAKSMELAAVMGCNELGAVAAGVEVYIDGRKGSIEFGYSEMQREEYVKQIEAEKVIQAELQSYIGRETLTRDGRRIELHANLLDIQALEKVQRYTADGIGLFRTEMLFLERAVPPGEEEQTVIYRNILERMNPRPVIIRTIDIGGDKACDYLKLTREDNPFLGVRGLRLCLAREEIFRTQIRAILRASTAGSVKLMFPMVSAGEEFQRAKQMIKEVKQELADQNVPYDEKMPVGIMIEVPSAAIMADILVQDADFISIGSNDLAQYVMAADRYNPQTADLCSPYQPAVLRMIAYVIQCSSRAGKPCGMCGEAASDPRMIPFLVGAGLSEFSVNVGAVLKTRRLIAKIDKTSAGNLADRVLKAATAELVEKELDDFMGGKEE